MDHHPQREEREGEGERGLLRTGEISAVEAGDGAVDTGYACRPHIVSVSVYSRQWHGAQAPHTPHTLPKTTTNVADPASH